jgi:hypothetical protein
MIADKIVFLIFMPQFSSAQAASQETLGSEPPGSTRSAVELDLLSLVINADLGMRRVRSLE